MSPSVGRLARTSDIVTYEDLGEVILRGADDEQDKFIFAGSVFEAHGRFLAMYTDFNRDFSARGRPAQVLMLATSDDLVTWTKTDRQVVPPQPRDHEVEARGEVEHSDASVG